ncbi:Protein IVY1 [Leucoagaricus sp. SymC.cos]|nr:Protein IVY1 [Leucoagaricus sp. SymC.cos]
MDTSAAYRSALLAMSKATAAFADAMERCSGLKGPSYEAGSRLQAAAGVHHLIGNLWHVLAETLDKKFEKPLRQSLDTYKTIVHERSTSYERALRERSQIIRQTEMRNMNRKERNLQSFREALTVLQRQVDELDDLKAAHYQEIIEHEEEVWDVVQNKVCIVVRSTMDVFDRFTAKASDPIIEPMLQSVPDPFDAYGPPQSEDQIFSILAPLSMTQQTPSSSTPSPPTGTPERDTSDSLPSSLGNTKVTSCAWADAHYSSSPPSTPPRSVSPPHTTHLSRRHSVPSHRKAESKLRSVLSVIDEGRSSRHEGSNIQNLNGTTPPLPPSQQTTSLDTTGGEPDSGHLSHNSWSFTYGQSPYEYGNNSNSSTPRNSTLFTSTVPTVPPESPCPSTNDRRDSDDQLLTHASV